MEILWPGCQGYGNKHTGVQPQTQVKKCSQPETHADHFTTYICPIIKFLWGWGCNETEMVYFESKAKSSTSWVTRLLKRWGISLLPRRICSSSLSVLKGSTSPPPTLVRVLSWRDAGGTRWVGCPRDRDGRPHGNNFVYRKCSLNRRGARRGKAKSALTR